MCTNSFDIFLIKSRATEMDFSFFLKDFTVFLFSKLHYMLVFACCCIFCLCCTVICAAFIAGHVLFLV